MTIAQARFVWYAIVVMDTELKTGNEKLRAENATLRQGVAELAQRLAGLEARLAAGKRQPTPFARRKGVDKPKRPGRKKGPGEFSYRRPPAAGAVQETKEAPLAGCPACGGELRERKEQAPYVL